MGIQARRAAQEFGGPLKQWAAAQQPTGAGPPRRRGWKSSMSLRVSGKNMNIGEALRTHTAERVEAVAAKFFDGGVSGHVTLTPDGIGYRADCNLHLSSGMILQADGRAQDPHAAVDQSIDRIEKRLRRYKSRLKSHHDHHEAGKAETVPSYVLEAPDQELEAPAEFSPAVIAESTTQLRRRSVSQAVLDLDLTGAPVVIFRHASTGRLNIVYRRDDQNVGWIDTPDGA
jgi:ribosomal subunit interface protein